MCVQANATNLIATILLIKLATSNKQEKERGKQKEKIVYEFVIYKSYSVNQKTGLSQRLCGTVRDGVGDPIYNATQ